MSSKASDLITNMSGDAYLVYCYLLVEPWHNWAIVLIKKQVFESSLFHVEIFFETIVSFNKNGMSIYIKGNQRLLLIIVIGENVLI